jgi:hypothetical protein
MKFHNAVMPIDRNVEKTILIALAVIVLSIGAAIFSFTLLLTSSDISQTLYGMALVWAGSLLFFYAVITEEHTMKEIFLRQSYFFTGLLVMILGTVFISYSGVISGGDIGLMEFGLLVLILGATLLVLSAQRSRDYSRRNAFMAGFAGLLLTLGGVVAGSLNTSYAGIFLMIFSAFWMGLRSKHAL